MIAKEKKLLNTMVIAALVAMMCVSVVWAKTPLRQAQARPNVVIIYGDDVGYGDVVCMDGRPESR